MSQTPYVGAPQGAVWGFDPTTSLWLPVGISPKLVAANGEEYAALMVLVSNANPNGQNTMVNSAPVVLPSDYVAPERRVAQTTPVLVQTRIFANAACNCVMPAVAGKTNYVEGFTITGYSSGTAFAVEITLGALLGNITNIYLWAAPVNVVPPALVITFPSPLPANAVNTAVTLSVPGLGVGTSEVGATLWGYVQ